MPRNDSFLFQHTDYAHFIDKRRHILAHSNLIYTCPLLMKCMMNSRNTLVVTISSRMPILSNSDINRTAVDVMQWLREVCSPKLLQTPIILGGPGVIVQIDESLFRHKPKVRIKAGISVQHTGNTTYIQTYNFFTRVAQLCRITEDVLLLNVWFV